VDRVAVVGAGGFIGTRLIEMFHLGKIADVRPIVRSAGGLASLARFALDCRIADARDREALAAAFKGCDSVVDLVKGDDATIEATVDPIYRAAEAAGVRRIVYLSTASVHGQAPPPGTDETSPLSDRHPISYNNAKVRAELRFRRLRSGGEVELVTLRPAIVYGPRSYWTDGFADALLRGDAYFVDGGRGICNAIYVDNLVAAIRAALLEPKADGDVFLLVDDEIVTWADLWGPIARAFGVEITELPNLPPPARRRRGGVFARSLRPPRPLIRVMPARLKRGIKGFIAGWNAPPEPSAWERPRKQSPTAGEEIALLHTCDYKFPNQKARRVLGAAQDVSFEEGCRRSIGWLSFAGYPISAEAPSGL
jgi:nucleoside-diphosphate-sugar epimerase